MGVFEKLNSIIKNVDLEKVTKDGAGFEELRDGYYLIELEEIEIKESKSSNQPMCATKFKIVEDGKVLTVDDNGDVNLQVVKGTARRKVFMYWSLKDETTFKRFVTDMLKFEDENHQSVLSKEMFEDVSILTEALSLLVGSRVFMQVSTTEKDGSVSVWQNLLSWDRAAKLELV